MLGHKQNHQMVVDYNMTTACIMNKLADHVSN